MKPEDLANIRRMIAEGQTPEQIAKSLGMHYTTLIRKLSQAGYKIDRPYSLVPLNRVEIPAEATQ